MMTSQAALTAREPLSQIVQQAHPSITAERLEPVSRPWGLTRVVEDR